MISLPGSMISQVYKNNSKPRAKNVLTMSIKTTFICIILVTLLFTDTVFAESVDDMTFYTEEYPPFNFKEKGVSKGFAVDILGEMLKLLNSSKSTDDFEFRPWANSYRMLEKVKNVCLFGTTRTEKRENNFKWVGPISKNVYGLMAKKNRKIKIKSFEDIKKYRVGGIRDDVAIQLLVERGIPKNNIQQVAKTRSNIDKLNFNRIDMWAYGVNVAKWELKASGFNPEDYEVVYIIDDVYDVYYAINKETSDKLVTDLQWALDEVKKQGLYQKIMDKYLK